MVDDGQPRDLPRTVNRWTLEPVLTLLPFLITGLLVLGLSALFWGGTSDSLTAIAFVVVFIILIALPTLAALRRRT